MSILGKRTRRGPRTAFREMDLGLVGVVGLALTGLLLAAALNVGRLSSLLGEVEYTAQLVEAGGLRDGDDVRIAGVKVGSVKGVNLEDDSVEIDFTAGKVDLGDKTRVIVRADNALGSKYLAVEPAGRGLTKQIPIERTDPGISVNEELGRLSRETSKIDEQQLARSFASMSKVLSQSPEEFGSALKGVSALSRTIARRDEELETLLQRASSISGLLAERQGELTSIMSNGSKLFAELAMRREIMSRLLDDVIAASEQLRGLARDHKTSLRPVLTELRTTGTMLAGYRDTLDYALRIYGPFARSLGESVASGPFFQAYLANLTSPEQLVTGGIKGIVQQEIEDY